MAKKKRERETLSDPVAQELREIAHILKRQNNLLSKFFGGLLVGLGTAVGATIVATLVFLFIRQLLHSLGIDLSEMLMNLQ